MKSFLQLYKTVKIAQEKSDLMQIYSNFLAFFSFLFEMFSLLDPDPHIECESGRVNKCGSRRIRFHRPSAGYDTGFLAIQFPRDIIPR